MKTIRFIASLGIAAGAGLLIGVIITPRKEKRAKSELKKERDVAKYAIEYAASKELELEEAKKRIEEAAEKQNESSYLHGLLSKLQVSK